MTSIPPRVLVEIIASSADDCEIIQAAGADRIELCGAMALGGTTPSLGLVAEAKRRTTLPLMVMLRPREAGMAFTEGEFATMLADLPYLFDAGADGIVTGISLPGGGIDVARMATIAEIVKGKGRALVCHRAFDLTPDPLTAMEQLIDIGFDRILTSGQRSTAAEGAELIAALVQAAGGRIEILPACGIDGSNAASLIARTGVDQVHLAAFDAVRDPSTDLGRVTFGLAPADDPTVYGLTDAAQVESVVAAVSKAARSE